MTKTGKFVAVALVASVTMAFAVSNASAARLSINRNADFEIIWTGLRFIAPIGDTVVCSVTLLGHFHSLTITKTAESLIGFIDHARLGACTGGTATILVATLPWHVQYESFRGRLPTITQVVVKLVNASFQINNDTETCLMATTAAEPAIGTTNIEAGGAATLLGASGSIDLEGGGFCDFLSPNGQFEGTGTITHLEGITIIIRLV